MEIVQMINQTSDIITEIKKCVNLYHYCDDKEKIYNHLLLDIYKLKKVDVLMNFILDDFDENSSIEVLKNELLKLYKILSNEFIKLIHNFYCGM